MFGKGRHEADARSAEMRGDLARAVELFARAGLPHEAARVLFVRADAEVDPRLRLQHLTQAVDVAPREHETFREAVKRRGELVMAMNPGPVLTALARHDVRRAAEALETIGELGLAAAAYRLGSDPEGLARALAAAGEVDALETLLDGQRNAEQRVHEAAEKSAQLELHMRLGERRRARAILQDLASTDPGGRWADELRRFDRRRACGPELGCEHGGKLVRAVLGSSIVLGRTEGQIRISSASLSKAHARLARRDGRVVLEDLESKNGIRLRGMPIRGAFDVGDGVDVMLGTDVPLRLKRDESMAGALTIAVAGRTYTAPLADALQLERGWQIVLSEDGWLTLVAPSAFQGALALPPELPLFLGDEIQAERGGPTVLRILREDAGA